VLTDDLSDFRQTVLRDFRARVHPSAPDPATVPAPAVAPAPHPAAAVAAAAEVGRCRLTVTVSQERDSDAPACMRRHQAFALAAVREGVRHVRVYEEKPGFRSGPCLFHNPC
jgi:hypothetical protein